MDADGLPLIGMGIDLNKVEAIPAKRTLAFLNHFVTHTVAFLNRFSSVCEEKLETLTVRIGRLETTMYILEAKLSSIPGLENVAPAPTSSTSAAGRAAGGSGVPSTPSSDTTLSNLSTSTPATAGSARSVQNTSSLDALTTSEGSIDVANQGRGEESPPQPPEDPQYAKYRQLLRMGVPVAAFRQKMIGEGLDPNVLESMSPAGASSGSSPAPSAGPPSLSSTAAVSSASEAEKNANKNPVDDDFSDVDEQSNSSNDEVTFDSD